jgi:hypothetical protein
VDDYFPQDIQPDLVIESQPVETIFDAWARISRNDPPAWNPKIGNRYQT